MTDELRRTVRFRALILDDLNKYVNIHRMKDADGKFDFTDVLHERYADLLDAESERDRLRVEYENSKLEIGGLRHREEVQSRREPMPPPPRITKKVVCEYHQGLIRIENSQEYCDQCMKDQRHPSCPRLVRERR